MLFYRSPRNMISSTTPYFIYAHKCGNDVYVGFSVDPVKRWNEHYRSAMDPNCREKDSPFHSAIRRTGQSNIKHFIVSTAKTEREARDIEAAAIKYYSTLNVRPEFTTKSYSFEPLDKMTSFTALDLKPVSNAWGTRDDSDREWVTGKIVMERGSKRVVSIAGGKFPAGLKVECSRVSRQQFNVGDLVKIKVALTERDGSKHLVAAKTAELLRA